MLSDVSFFVDRLWAVYYPALAIHRVPSIIPHEDGALLLRAVQHLVTPRLLFPDKPALESDSEAVRRYSGALVAGSEENTSIAFGYAGESYVDFGIPVMFLPVFVYGLIMGMAFHGFLRLIRDREISIAVVTVIFWLSLYLFERSWSQTFGLAGNLMIYLGGVAVIVERLGLHRNGSRPVVSRLAPVASPPRGG
jgi:hypothetical protein